MKEATVPVRCPHHDAVLAIHQVPKHPESVLPVMSYVARCQSANGACKYELAIPAELVQGDRGIPAGSLAEFSFEQLQLGLRCSPPDQQIVWQQAFVARAGTLVIDVGGVL